MRAGGAWLWQGDYHNGRQLLAALKRRLQRSRESPARTSTERWAQERAKKQRLADTLSRVVVLLEPDGQLALRRAPPTAEAVRWAWPDHRGEALLVSLPTLIGALSAAGWTREGLDVHGLQGKLYPRFGVFSPTRQAYLHLLDDLPSPTGKTVLDVGCGTGVLSFVLLQRGASRAHGTDIEPRAVQTALFNAKSLGLDDRFSASVDDLWQDHSADLLVFNPPWVPMAPNTRLDRAVYDDRGATLGRFLSEAGLHLNPGGQVALLISDLPERLGLRAEGELAERFYAANLAIVQHTSRPASHRRAKRTDDPLWAARAAEQVQLWLLAPTSSKGRTPVFP